MDEALLHRELLEWYDREKRDLPWRLNQDPYRIWISEIMLQQTRVEAVLPYYARFLSHFPTVRHLAEAELDQVLNLWAGLGYYSRARNLHAAAVQVQTEFSGCFPADFDQLRTLKGIGPYTASAIASMAFGLEHCALDGNLERVFARLLALREDPKSSGRAPVSGLGESLVRLGRPGDVNQAVMDLASRLCVPREPRCGECPISGHCAARAQGVQALLPIRKAKEEKIQLEAEAWAIIAGEELLLARRPSGKWLSGLWDLPWRIVTGEISGSPSPFGEERATCVEARTITKHKITFQVRGVRCAERPGNAELARLCADVDEYRWVHLRDLHGINLPRPSEKALEKILSKLN